MNARNFLVASLLLIPAITFTQEESTNQTYAQEFLAFKNAPENHAIFDEMLQPDLHAIERDGYNFKFMSLSQRMACTFILHHDVIVVTPENMPKLYTSIDEFCKESRIPTPTIFITVHEGFSNALSTKLFTSPGGIVIGQKLLFESTDAQLDAIIAHEIGHIKNNHTNKSISVHLAGALASGYASYKLYKYIKSKLGCNSTISVYEGLNLFMVSQYCGFILRGLIIGKKFEKEADEFAFKAGYAQQLIGFFEDLKQKEQLIDSDYSALNDRLQLKKAELPAPAFEELQNAYNTAVAFRNFLKWFCSTRFMPHPSNDDRIQAAQAYLPEPEKA